MKGAREGGERALSDWQGQEGWWSKEVVFEDKGR